MLRRMIAVRCSSGINHIFVHATHYPSLPLSSAFYTHSCLVFRPHNLIFHSNRFTCSLPSPFLLSFSLSITLSLPNFGLILSSLISFIPSNPHLFLSRRRGRESFSTGKLHPVCLGNLWKAQREKDD